MIQWLEEDCCCSLVMLNPAGLKATLHPAVSPHILALLIPPVSATLLKDLIMLQQHACTSQSPLKEIRQNECFKILLQTVKLRMFAEIRSSKTKTN